MKGNRAIIIAIVVVVVLAAAWYLLRRGSTAAAVDLTTQFEAASKKPDAAAFTLGDATLNGEAKKAVLLKPAVGTRLIYKVTVPDDAWLSVAVGLRPEGWTEEGNGVLFQVGISDGRTHEVLFSQHVNPFANQGDRKWIPVMVDLSTYAGEQVDLIFNTYSSPQGQAPDERGDLAAWGHPEIVVR